MNQYSILNVFLICYIWGELSVKFWSSDCETIEKVGEKCLMHLNYE